MLRNKFTVRVNLIILLLVISLLFFYIISCGFFSGEKKDIVPEGTEVEFEIKEGMTLKEIAGLLEEKGIIDSAFLFRLFVEERGKEGSLIPGIYTLEASSGYEEVLNKITAGGGGVKHKIIILSGCIFKKKII